MVFDPKVQAMLDRLSARLVALLRQEPDWKAAANEVADALDATNLDWGNPERMVVSLEPKLRPLARMALERMVNPANVDSPLDLVNNLLPSDHHLD